MTEQLSRLSGVGEVAGGHSDTLMCCHLKASHYRFTPKLGYLEYEIMTPYQSQIFIQKDLPQCTPFYVSLL